MIRIYYIVFFILILSLSGCVPMIKAVKMPSAENKLEINIPPESDIEPVSFHKILVTIKRGTVIGVLNPFYNFDLSYNPSSKKQEDVPNYMKYKGYQYACDTDSSQEILWGTGALTLSGIDGEFSDYFREAFIPYGYDVTGNRDIVFERNQELLRGTYRVAANVVDIKTNICQLRDVFWTGMLTNKVIGEMWMDIDWTIYSTLERKKVAKISTNGYAEVSKPQSAAVKLLLLNSFAAAAENLAKDPNFLKIVSKDKSSVSDAIRPLKKYDILNLENIPLFDKPFVSNIEDILKSVVTIRSTGGHGSGFVISENGYLLTNAHVAGKSNKVRVKFNSGFEINGIVKRKDEVRDVALIQVEASGLPPLPINMKTPKVASKTYAIGTPLKENLESTVTTGIISAIRIDDRSKLPFIQSDVSVQQGNSGGPLLDEYGNVLGMTVSGYRDATGVNLFIPISSALERLNIKIVKE